MYTKRANALNLTLTGGIEMEVKRVTFEERMYYSLKRKGLAEQFEHAGIYAILLDGKIVYIGKSINILKRMAQHYVGIRL